MSKIIARHLTVDMYNCKPDRLTNFDNQKQIVIDLFNNNRFDVISAEIHTLNPTHKTMVIVFAEGHCSIHSFTSLGYIAIDLFLCEPGASPEKLFSSLRNIFSPEKTKTTHLRRGDFGTVADMKPKITTKTSPLRRIHNTGAKVIRMLSHRRR